MVSQISFTFSTYISALVHPKVAISCSNDS